MQQQLWNLPTMKALRLALAALVVTFMQAVAAHAVDIKEITSPGGIKAWIVSDSTIPIIAMNFSFRGGTANDPADKVGRAYFLSGMLDEGAGDLPSEAFQERMSELAVRMSFDAEREYFEGSFQTLSENRDAAFELLRKAVAEPRFDTVPMNKVRGQILVGIKSDSENPSRIASEALLKTMLASHPYANDRKGTVDTVNAMTPDDLRDAWKATFARDRLLVGIVGDISEEEAGKMLDKVFGGLPESAGPVSVPDVQWPEKGSITIVERDIPQSVMTFAMPGILELCVGRWRVRFAADGRNPREARANLWDLYRPRNLGQWRACHRLGIHPEQQGWRDAGRSARRTDEDGHRRSDPG
jgi:zinc protease